MVNYNRPSISHGFSDILSFKGIGVTTLTFQVTWRHRSYDHWILKEWFPICSQYDPTMYLARLLRYWTSNISGSRPWPFGVTWRHLSRDHWIRNMGFPIGGQLEPTVYLARFFEILSFKDIGVTTLTFGVTWRHLSHDHWIRNLGFPIGGQFEATIYLAQFLRYQASKVLGSRLGVQPMLKAKKLTAHASYHVTYR